MRQLARVEVSTGRALRILHAAPGQALGHGPSVNFLFLYWYVSCGIVTWVMLVADRQARLHPRMFVPAFRLAVQDFGWRRVSVWGGLCLVAWWLVLVAWSTSWLRPRR
jgi:hypothetical protein